MVYIYLFIFVRSQTWEILPRRPSHEAVTSDAAVRPSAPLASVRSARPRPRPSARARSSCLVASAQADLCHVYIVPLYLGQQWWDTTGISDIFLGPESDAITYENNYFLCNAHIFVTICLPTTRSQKLRSIRWQPMKTTNFRQLKRADENKLIFVVLSGSIRIRLATFGRLV